MTNSRLLIEFESNKVQLNPCRDSLHQAAMGTLSVRISSPRKVNLEHNWLELEVAFSFGQGVENASLVDRYM
jgi:hypothetical protein